MDMTEKKCVMVIDEELPAGVIGNTCAILGATLGKQLPQHIGEDVTDGSGNSHMGIIDLPVVLLKGNKPLLQTLRQRLYEEEAFADLMVVDFSDIAQSCNVYSEYRAKAARVPAEAHIYRGIALYGDKKNVNRLTGALGLLR